VPLVAFFERREERGEQHFRPWQRRCLLSRSLVAQTSRPRYPIDGYHRPFSTGLESLFPTHRNAMNFLRLCCAVRTGRRFGCQKELLYERWSCHRSLMLTISKARFPYREKMTPGCETVFLLTRAHFRGAFETNRRNFFSNNGAGPFNTPGFQCVEGRLLVSRSGLGLKQACSHQPDSTPVGVAPTTAPHRAAPCGGRLDNSEPKER